MHANYLRLKQSLINLLSNAVKYNREGGRITLTLEQRDNGRIRFTVRDSAEREAVAIVSAQVLVSGNRSSPSITGSAIIEDTYSEETGFLFNEDLFPQDIAYGEEGGATISLTPINF